MELPLSPNQERMYFLQMADPESRAFNAICMVSFSSLDSQPLHPSLLTPTLEMIVRRNASLRVTFHQDSNDENHPLKQRIHPLEDFEICRVSRASLTTSEQGQRDSIRDECFKAFDLSVQAFRFVIFLPTPQEMKLCMVFHHLIVDGHSACSMVRDILTLVCGKELPAVAETPEDHLANVILRCRANANENSSVKQKNLHTWIELLQTADSCASLSARPGALSLPVNCNESVQQYLHVPKRVMAAVRSLSKSTSASMTAVLSTLFAACLYSHTGQSDIVIGVISVNRTAETQNIMAYLANTLPLRVDFTRSPPLSDLLQQVQKNWGLAREGGVDLLDLLPHVPCLQHKSATGRGVTISTNPLQVMLSYLNFYDFIPENVQVDGRQFSCEYSELRSGHAHIDLYLEIHPKKFRQSSGEFTFCWEYKKFVITPDEVCGLHDLFCEAAECLAAGATVVEAFKLEGCGPSLKGESEMQMSLYGGLDEQETNIPNSHSLYIPRFEKKASEIPTCTAFRYKGEEVSYAETRQLMTQLAALLLAKGIRSGDHIGIYMHRTHWLYLAILATLKCAAAYVPIALQNPPERVTKILKLSEATLLVTEESLLQNLPGYSGASLCIDTQTIRQTITTETAKFLPMMPEFDYSPDQIFYIIFTSGTTGEPKGIAITQSNMRAFINVFLGHISPEMSSVTLASSNVSFDAHGLDFLGPLLNGACLVVVDSVLNMQEGITFAFAAPSAARLVQFPRDMRAVMVGGEVFTPACYENLKHVPVIFNVYGPTECTVYVSEKRVLSAEDLSTIGKPHTKAMILDDSKQLVPIGSTGILHIAGPQVSDIGYYKNPEKNKDAFIRNPYNPTETLYNTRDVVRMFPDGSLQFLGRSDDQVKLRGMRFQLLEVENTLISHSKVSAASTMVRNKGDSSAQLVAFITPTLDSPSLDEVLQHTRSRLPSYMVPSLVLSLGNMPITKEGKIDRKALAKLPLGNAVCTSEQTREPDKRSPDFSVSNTETSTISTDIASVFEKVLGLEECSISADFFASGGHSLLTFRLVQLINKKFGCSLNIGHILQYPTPSSLAKVVTDYRQAHTVTKMDADFNPTHKQEYSDKSNVGVARKSREAAGVSESPNSSKSQAQAHKEYSPPKVSRSTSIEVVKGDREGAVHTTSSQDSKESTCAPSRDCSPQGLKSEAKSTEKTEEAWNFNYISPVPSAALSPELSTRLAVLFNSGGTKLSSVDEISVKLCEETGFHIPGTALLHYTSLDVLQSHLKLKTVLAYASTAQSPTVVIHPQKSTSDLPIFFVHGGIIGWPFPYIKLAQSLERYSVAIQRTTAAPTSSFEDMAAYYVKAVRSVQPHGPYTLIGVCFGAQLVYEMCRQLCSAGECVKLAVMVNNSPAIEKLPSVFDDLGRPLPLTPSHPFHFLQSTLQLRLPEAITKNPQRDYSKEADVGDLTASVLEEFPWLPFTATELKQAYLSFLYCLRCVWFQYHPQPTDGIKSCVLIRDHRDHPLFLSHHYGLLSLVPPGGLSVLVSPQPLGLLSEKTTMEYVSSVLRLYLNAV